MKRFIRQHGSYDRDNLQNWMNLFYFIVNDPKDKYDKVLKFIELAINSPKRVKYRDVMCKKAMNSTTHSLHVQVRIYNLLYLALLPYALEIGYFLLFKAFFSNKISSKSRPHTSANKIE